jgi:hypothetical protein
LTVWLNQWIEIRVQTGSAPFVQNRHFVMTEREPGT